MMRFSVWYTVLSICLAVLALPTAGQAQSDEDAILQAAGVLEAGDETLDDGRFYDSYRFEGQAGQAVIVNVTSDEFDTYLFLRDGSGATLARNDDWNGESDSTIGYVLPAAGSYELWVNSYVQSGQGNYQVRVLGTDANNVVVQESEADRLNQQGVTLTNQAKYPAALELFKKSLAIRQEIGDRRGEGESLNNIGFIYSRLGQYPKALEFYEQSLAISQEIGDRRGEGTMLNNIGGIYSRLGQYPKALEFYEQSLAISQEIGDRRGEGITLNNLGYTLESLDYPVLAIVYFKQAVNIFETIRTDIRENDQTLDQGSQQSFTEEVANSYRKLADLLLQQDRIFEAQRVLDLLKVQELDDFLRGVRSEITTKPGIDLLPQETEFLNNQDNILAQAIPIATELQDLRKIPFPNRSTEQNDRIQFLETQQSNILDLFLDFIASDDVQQLIVQLSRTVTDPDQDILTELNQFPTLRDNLRDIGNAVLLYPLILEDRLELVLVTADGPPTRHPVPIPRDQLTTKISNFQQLLRDKNSNPELLAQELYTLLIKPLETALTAAEAETIIYAPDGLLRYIPLAALHDGTQWLAQRYEVNHITAASLTDLNLKPSKEPIILAGAFQTGQHDISVGDQTYRFNGLPFAGIEVDLLQESFPTTPFYDGDFSRAATEPLMNDHTIVHLATHASLLIGDPSESFILFGNGERLTLEELKSWRGRLQTVDLMVLSACETGTGGSIKDSTGEEILGFGYLMQDAGARAVLSSLWPVSDGGTQELMTNFYEALKVEGMSKADALQQAQIALITGNQIDAGSGERFSLRPRNPESAEALSNNSLSHPYYWAPFILIGNGL